jgi:RNA polymerase sigma-70 factor (ECF subfamily)
MPASPDALLLLALSRGDESAARNLHARINPRLTAYTRALLRGSAHADDIVQQTWLRAISRPADELARIDNAPAWLIRIARSIALNHIRSHSRTLATENRHASLNGTKPDTLTRDHADLHAAIDTLTDDQRELILLRHIADLTFDQIAETLGENRSTIASRYRAALESLRTHLQPRKEAAHARSSIA